MNKRSQVALVGASAFTRATTSSNIASAVGGDDHDDHEAPIAGQALVRRGSYFSRLVG